MRGGVTNVENCEHDEGEGFVECQLNDGKVSVKVEKLEVDDKENVVNQKGQ